MSGLVNALNIGKSSLLAGQKAIEVTGNNISNVNTPGYSREVPIFSDFPSIEMRGFFVGRGAQVALVDREHDAFITRQIQEKSAGLGDAEAKADPLTELERIISISDNSLASKIDEFFGSWQDLSIDPSSRTSRETVIISGEHLATAFSQTIEDLNTLRRNLDINLISHVEELNAKLDEMVSLNGRITTIEATGQIALADRDRRDLLVQEISAALGTRSVESPTTGQVSLFLPNGIPVLQDAYCLNLSYDNSGDYLDVYLEINSQRVSFSTDNIGGSFSGMLQMRDEFIPDVIADLDQLAYNLAIEVNQVHQWGTGLDGGFSRPFFTPPAQATGSAKALSVAISDYRQVAAGRSDATGDNTNALDIAALGQAQNMNGTESYVEFYSSLASRIGTESRQNQLALAGSQDSLEQLSNLRDAKVGVSLEEEMINLLKYQRSFEASAKFVATIDEVMDSLLSLKR
ncbi:MAG: flagellar hook-associated protein FlgK [Desulfuromonadaceae bacterium]|jgi:flagellar hook-associated protein 1